MHLQKRIEWVIQIWDWFYKIFSWNNSNFFSDVNNLKDPKTTQSPVTENKQTSTAEVEGWYLTSSTLERNNYKGSMVP